MAGVERVKREVKGGEMACMENEAVVMRRILERDVREPEGVLKVERGVIE